MTEQFLIAKVFFGSLPTTVCLCLAVLVLGGCRGSFAVNAGSSTVAPAPATPGVSVTNSQLSVTADSALGAAILLGIIAANGLRSGPVGGTGGGSTGTAAAERAPDPDPSRRVNVQDCSKPVDYAAGNLLCR